MTTVDAVPGVSELEHTADVGLEVQAPSLESLFDRAARGMLALVRGTGEDEPWEREQSVPAGPPDAADAGRMEERPIELRAPDEAALLVAWLREVLYLLEAEGLAYTSARFEELEPGSLRAVVRTAPSIGPAVRELKGITYHGLDVRPAEPGWVARVIFDI